MPAEDPGDVFLRHRTAVLDALLADPALEPSGVAAAGAVSAPESAGESLSVDHEFSAEPVAETLVGEPDSGPAAKRRANTGPKASDRILALLNGQSPDAAGGLEFTADHSEAAAARLRTAENAEQRAEPVAPAQPEKAAASRPGSVGELGRTAVVYLKRPKIALAVAGVLVLLLILVFVTSGGEDKPSQNVVVTQASGGTPLPTSAAPATPASAPIQVRSAQAHCPQGSSDAMDAFSGESGKAWKCVRAYRVDGQVLTIDLGKTYQVDSIGIVPGFDSVGTDGTDQWSKYRTVSRVSYRFDDSNATTYTQQTLDQRNVVTTEIKPAVTASKITVTLLESKGDPSANTTAVSSIVITGH
ncbi:discoidin domain-containing protein [Nocardia blacklockiae]|uniref:discoidin domain-containing protein n=1 Tax=Nocardia blacklockiae TaxID=480036 RepID=UPI00189628F3|nr:discoidin domain-containing protein [Nocardia blacklockiae]MBF6175632.1 discoidin domain-containing protein [Nocardia blacklockiae]